MNNIHDRINSTIGNDFKDINKCREFYSTLVKEKKDIEYKLSNLNNEVPSKVNDALSEINKLKTTISSFIIDFEKYLKTFHEDDLESTFEKLSVFSMKQKEYDKCLKYLNLLKLIEVISSEIRKCYLEVNWSKCISLYSKLCQLSHAIIDSKCENLVNYMNNIIFYWHDILKKKLSSEYEQLLKTMNWPFVIRNKAFPEYPSEDLKPKFQSLTKFLIQLELPENLRGKSNETSILLMDFPTLSIPVLLLLAPLQKRFIFHFCGTKQTNRIEKPEWMFSQILTWIKNHELFFINWIEPVYLEFTNMAKIEFIGGLLKLVTEKLNFDILNIQNDDNLFAHTLDEILSFHREITKHYGYPSTLGSVLCVLIQSQIFIKWLNLERKCAEKRMDDMFNSSTAWNIVTEDDNCKITECADKFIILLSTITDRYSILIQPGHRLQFLELQLDLIDEFRLRLAQLKQDDYTDTLESDLPAILNTVHYVSVVLIEWETNTHFIMLHHFKSQLQEKENIENISVFSDVLSVMNHFSDEIIKEICDSVILEVKAKSRPYRKDRWNTMPSMNLDTDLRLTISGCSMFQTLNNKLFLLRDLIAPTIFQICWKRVAENFCKLMIDDVILVNMFSEGGAQQLQFDVKRNILPLFAQFTSKPEVYFKSLIEACDLLCSQDTFHVDNVSTEINALTKHQAVMILNRKLRKTVLSALESI